MGLHAAGQAQLCRQRARVAQQRAPPQPQLRLGAAHSGASAAGEDHALAFGYFDNWIFLQKTIAFAGASANFPALFRGFPAEEPWPETSDFE